MAPHIKTLSKEIGEYFINAKAIRVRRSAMGNKKVNLWKAVKIAKKLNHRDIPNNLSWGGVPVAEDRVADAFAEYFSDKIKTNVLKTKIDPLLLYKHFGPG